MEKRVGLLRFEGINIKIVKREALRPVDAIIMPEYPDHLSDVAKKCLGFEPDMERYEEQVRINPFKYGDVYFYLFNAVYPYVTHVVTMGASPEKQFETVFKAVFRAVVTANHETRIERIAVPIDLGADALTPEQNARAIIGAVDTFSRICGYPIVKDVQIFADNEPMDAAEKVLAEGSYRNFGTQDGQDPFDPDKWVVEREGWKLYKD